jgi:hypothetical protein
VDALTKRMHVALVFFAQQDRSLGNKIEALLEKRIAEREAAGLALEVTVRSSSSQQPAMNRREVDVQQPLMLPVMADTDHGLHKDASLLPLLAEQRLPFVTVEHRVRTLIEFLAQGKWAVAPCDLQFTAQDFARNAAFLGDAAVAEIAVSQALRALVEDRTLRLFGGTLSVSPDGLTFRFFRAQ